MTLSKSGFGPYPHAVRSFINQGKGTTDAALIIDDAEDSDFSKTDWVIVTRDQALVENDAIAGKASDFDEIPGLRLWTDDFSNLFQILK